MNFVRLGLLAAGLALSACGGGGGSGTSISVSPSALTFTSEEGDGLPPPQNVLIRYRGDGLLVGFAPGYESTDWITIIDNGGTAGSHGAGIQMNYLPAAPGTRTTLVRFVTGRTDGSGIKTDDVVVTQTLLASTFSAQATPESLNFEAAYGGQLPPAQQLELEFSDGAIVSAVPSEPWIVVGTPNPSTSPAMMAVSVNTTGFAVGSTTPGSIAITVQRASGSTRQVSVPVSYVTGPPMAVSPLALAFTGIAGSSAAPTPATRSFTISGDNLDWTAESDQAWLALAQAAGTEPATVGFTLDHAGLAAGAHEAHVTVHDAFSGATHVLDVTLTVQVPGLVITPATPAFTIDGDSTAEALAQVIAISDQSDGDPAFAADWTVSAISAPWLTVTPDLGTTNPAAEVTLAVDPDALADIENGSHTAVVTFAFTDSAGVERTHDLEVDLALTLPRVSVVAPYVAVEGRAGAAVLRGKALTGLEASQVKFGDTPVSTLEVVSDTELRVTYPALGAGRQGVAIGEMVDASPAELVVLAPATRPYAAFDADQSPRRLVFDNERDTLYAVNNMPLHTISRYQLVDGTWTQLDPLSVTNVQDATLSLDGQQLYIMANKDFYTLDLEDPEATPVLLYHMTFPSSTDIFYWFGLANDGHAQITRHSTCCSGGGFLMLDWLAGTTTVTSYPYPFTGLSQAGRVVASGDGRVVHASSDYAGWVYDATTSELTERYTIPRIDATNLDGTRSSYYGAIYDQDFVELGALASTTAMAAFSLRTDRAYAYRVDSNASKEVLVVDLEGALAGGVYPAIANVAIADNPEDPSFTMTLYNSQPAAVSADGQTFFFQGNRKLVIVPLGTD